MVDREMGWDAALRSKLCELEHAGPAKEQETHEACPLLVDMGPESAALWERKLRD